MKTLPLEFSSHVCVNVALLDIRAASIADMTS